MPPPLRVLIADDHPLIIEGLKSTLALLEIEVVDQTSSTDQVVECYARSKPDVVVLDIRFDEPASGLDVAKALLLAHPEARIVFYSQFDTDELVREAYRIGGSSFITKNTLVTVLADAIKQAAEGKINFLPSIMERLALFGVRGDESPQAKLDPREFEVFKLMAEGYTNLEMTEALGLSPTTISLTSRAIKDKLGIHRAASITRLAVKHKIIEA